MSNFDEIDKLLGSAKNDQGYDILKARYDKGEKSVDVCYRLAQFCHEKASMSPRERREQFIVEGIKYAEEAMKQDPKHFKSIKWCAILTGQLTDFNKSQKQKFENGKNFKDLLDRALAIQNNDSTLFHLRGRFKFAIASLSWVERKLAGAFFGTVPSHSYSDALEDFNAAQKNNKGTWLENSLYIAKCQLALKDKENAKKTLNEAVKISAASDAEADVLAEANEMLAKL